MTSEPLPETLHYKLTAEERSRVATALLILKAYRSRLMGHRVAAKALEWVARHYRLTVKDVRDSAVIDPNTPGCVVTHDEVSRTCIALQNLSGRCAAVSAVVRSGNTDEFLKRFVTVSVEYVA